MTSWFSNGGALFRSSVLEPVPRDLRSLDVNFGILPFPKLDENQDKYYTLPEEYSLVFSIPVTADADFASLIMEALAVESTGREPFRRAASRSFEGIAQILSQHLGNAAEADLTDLARDFVDRTAPVGIEPALINREHSGYTVINDYVKHERIKLKSRGEI